MLSENKNVSQISQLTGTCSEQRQPIKLQLQVKCIDKWSSLMRIGVMVSSAALQSALQSVPWTRCIVQIADKACLFSAKIYSAMRGH